MNIILMAIGLFVVIIVLATGYLIKYKKAYWLISGYNTMPAERKKNVDVEALAAFAAKTCFLIAAIIFVAAIFALLGKMAISGIVFALILPVVIYTLIKAQKFDKGAYDSDGNMKTGAKAMIGVVIVIIAASAIGVGLLLSSSSKPAEYAFENGVLNISGLYGQKIAVSEITALEIKDTIPEVLLRTNGSALGTMLKGNFKLQDIGQAKLFIDTSKPPFIFIKTNSATIILNCQDSDKTKALYNELKTAWQK